RRGLRSHSSVAPVRSKARAGMLHSARRPAQHALVETGDYSLTTPKRGASRPPARLQNRACEFPRTRLLGGRSLSRIPLAAVDAWSRLRPPGGSEAALWELADGPLPLPRGQGLPFIPKRCRRAHDVCTPTGS